MKTSKYETLSDDPMMLLGYSFAFMHIFASNWGINHLHITVRCYPKESCDIKFNVLFFQNIRGKRYFTEKYSYIKLFFFQVIGHKEIKS